MEDVGIIIQYPFCCALGFYVQIRLYFSWYWQKMKEICVYLGLKIYCIAVGFFQLVIIARCAPTSYKL